MAQRRTTRTSRTRSADGSRAASSSGHFSSRLQGGSRSSARAGRTALDEDSPAVTRASRRTGSYRAIPGGRYAEGDAAGDAAVAAGDTGSFGSVDDGITSTRVGDLRRDAREQRLRKSRRRHIIRAVLVAVLVAVLAVGAVFVYYSDLFKIQNVAVRGVEHLTSDEMAQVANVPADTTLLRVDTDTIKARVSKSAWVQDVQVNRVWPDTLEIVVTERTVAAVVEVPNASGSSVKSWAIAPDHVWLMPIPAKGTDAARTTSAKIYEDADAALHISDVPYGTVAEIGSVCVDDNVNNALDIVSGLTTDLAGQVVHVSAVEPVETTLMLDSGVEIAFGKAEFIRDKERVILEILDQVPGVVYINVRMVEQPTWRAV